MKRGSKFLIGFAAAALTYAGLMLFIGPRSFGYGRFHAYGEGRYMHCERFNRGDGDNSTTVPLRQEESFQTNPENYNQ